MFFNSYEFLLVFLPLFLLGLGFLQRTQHKDTLFVFVILMSCLFYARHSFIYLGLFLFSILLNWSLASYTTLNKRWLIFGICLNLGLLISFKYLSLVLTSLRILVINLPDLNIALPLAISFYTFHQISFLVDCYKKDIKVLPRFLPYVAYVIFFPQLIAGPIVRYREIEGQFSRNLPFKITCNSLRLGIPFVVLGLIKKVLIADTLAEFANQGFSMVSNLTFLESWLTLLSFGFQIYFDFSAYSEIAIGLGLMVNIRLPQNFNRPYLASNIISFWRRWHITLSRFLRDYLYIPLGGNQHGIFRSIRNLIVVMALGGLWHGAHWNFLVWGLLHGVYLAINHLWRKYSMIRLPVAVSWVITLFLVMIAWVPFRTQSLAETLAFYSILFEIRQIVLPENLMPLVQKFGLLSRVQFQISAVISVFSILALLGSFAMVGLPSVQTVAIRMMRSKLFAMFYGGLLCLVLWLLWERPNVFIYFNF